MIDTRQRKRHLRTLEEVKSVCRPSNKIEAKQAFVERVIEKDLQYFGYKNQAS